MIHFWGKTKSEALNRMKNANLSKKADNYNYIKKIVYYSDVKQYTRDQDQTILKKLIQQLIKENKGKE